MPFFPFDPAILGRGLDHEVIIRHQMRQVGIAARQLENHRVIAVGANLGDVGQIRRRRRGTFGPAMIVDRRDHVARGHRTAVMEGGLARQLEAPFAGIVLGRLPVGGKVGAKLVLVGDLGQVGAAHMAAVDHQDAGGGRRIPAVGGVAVMHADAEGAAARGRRPCGAGPGQPERKAGRGRAPEHAATVEVDAVMRSVCHRDLLVPNSGQNSPSRGARPSKFQVIHDRYPLLPARRANCGGSETRRD